jgi:hypothetical protein
VQLQGLANILSYIAAEHAHAAPRSYTHRCGWDSHIKKPVLHLLLQVPRSVCNLLVSVQGASLLLQLSDTAMHQALPGNQGKPTGWFLEYSVFGCGETMPSDVEVQELGAHPAVYCHVLTTTAWRHLGPKKKKECNRRHYLWLQALDSALRSSKQAATDLLLFQPECVHRQLNM